MWRRCARRGWIRCFWRRPRAPNERLELVAKYSSGFVYLVSRTGVTGEQQQSFGERPCRWSKDAGANATAAGGGLRNLDAGACGANWRARWKRWWWAARWSGMIERDPAGLEEFMRNLTRPLARA